MTRGDCRGVGEAKSFFFLGGRVRIGSCRRAIRNGEGGEGGGAAREKVFRI